MTITDADMAEMGVTGKTQTGRIPIKDFKERGIYQVPRKFGDAYTYIPLKDFRNDPEANPIPTAQARSNLLPDFVGQNQVVWLDSGSRNPDL